MRHIFSLLALSGLSTAWLPVVDKDIISANGVNLFNSSSNGHKRSLPGSKIRGVNLGSHFIFEPWISTDAWNGMGCDGTKSEFDCVMKLGQDAADAAFQKHWGSWTTQDDINQMVSYGLNTIRIPVGYWMREDLVYTDSEHFPRGGLAYLENICGLASDAGMYIIIDLHGAPGAQEPNQPFTGQYASTAGFFVDYQYERALKFLEWMATNIHQNDKFRNVGMLEVVNEPLQNADQVSSMRTSFYPAAFDRIRAAETKLGVQASDYLHVQMMEKDWGSGDPNEALTDTTYAVYDKHRYLKWDTSLDVSHDSYISASCGESTGDKTIVGEWSLSVPGDVQWNSDWDPSGNTDFYKNWFAAQVMAYEKQLGWVFWTWRADLGDYRWSYKDAVTAGVVPKDLDSVYNMGVC